MGKVIKQSVGEIVKCADTIDICCTCRGAYASGKIETDASESMVSYEPMARY
jgi:hypothetical protein